MRITEGDQFKNLGTGKSYSVKEIKNSSVILESEDRLNQVFTRQETVNLFYEKIMDGAVFQDGRGGGVPACTARR